MPRTNRVRARWIAGSLALSLVILAGSAYLINSNTVEPPQVAGPSRPSVDEVVTQDEDTSAPDIPLGIEAAHPAYGGEDATDTSESDPVRSVEELGEFLMEIGSGLIMLPKERKKLSERDVPAMLEMLNDNRYRRILEVIVFGLIEVDRHHASQAAFLDLIRKDLEWDTWQDELMDARLLAMSGLGLVGDEAGIEFARNMLDKEVVAREIGAWLDGPLPSYWSGKKEVVVADFQVKAAEALVFTQDKRNIALVEELYRQAGREEQRIWAAADPKRTYQTRSVEEEAVDLLHGSLMSTLGKRDYIDKYGLDHYLNLDSEQKEDVATDYYRKYDPALNKSLRP